MPEIIVVESGSDEPLRPLVDVPLPGDEPIVVASWAVEVRDPETGEWTGLPDAPLYSGADLCGGATVGGDDMDAIEAAIANPGEVLA